MQKKDKLDFKTIKPLTKYGNYVIDMPLNYFAEKIQEFIAKDNLDLDIDFQRPHVWTEEQQIKFVEFILRGGKTTPLLFNHPGWQSGYEGDLVIVDGKQRLTALLKFLNNELPIFNGYCLKDIKNFPISRYSVKYDINNLQTRKEVLQWYIELNSNGTVHTEEDISKVRKLLEEE